MDQSFTKSFRFKFCCCYLNNENVSNFPSALIEYEEHLKLFKIAAYRLSYHYGPRYKNYIKAILYSTELASSTIKEKSKSS